MTKQEILQAALALPEEERAQLLEEIAESLPGEEEDEAFIAMVNARVAAAEAGEPGIPADEVFAELRRR